MNITAKIDYRAKGKKWSNIKSHVNREHNNGHYSNKNINLAKSDFNFQGMLHDNKIDNNRYFSWYIKLQNIRKASTGHKNEIYKSVADYFRHRGYSNERNSMFEIGNQDYRKQYYQALNKRGLSDKQIRLIEARSLVDDVKEYNANSCQDVGAYAVNVDESTAHIHFQNLSYPPFQTFKNAGGSKGINLMPRGKKWKRKFAKELKNLGFPTKEINFFIKHKRFTANKPTASFNNTWRLEFPDAKNKSGQFDSRKALHMANDKYSQMIIRNFNKELAKANVKDFRLHLIRTGNVNHQTYSQFLSSKVNNDKLKKANKSLQANNESLRSNSQSITSSAVSDAAPIIGSKIIENTSEAKNEANQSASTSASVAVSSANASNLSAIWIWRQSASASLSISASSSAKAKASASMSAVAFSASSVSTANDELINKKADMMSNYCNMKINGHPLTSSQYQSCAKNGGYINGHHVNGDQIISSGLSLMSSKTKHTSEQASNYDYWKSSANSIHDDYNYWSASVSSISSASSSVTALHSSTRSMMTTTLMTFDNRTKAPTAKDKFKIYDKSDDSNLLAKLQDTLHTITDKVKNATRKIKLKIKHFIEPNKYAYSAMQDYINNHDESFSDIKNDTDKNGNPLPNAHSLNKKDTLNLFNYDTETVHNQRERNLGRNPDIPQ